jgi:hypothetical protein
VVECKKCQIDQCIEGDLEKRDVHERKVYGGASKGGG